MRDDYLMHYGVSIEDGAPGRGSGRYAKGSGENPNQHPKDFYDEYYKYKHDGMTERQIAEKLGVFNRKGNPDVNRLRAKLSNASNERRAHNIEVCQKYKDDGLTVADISKKTGIPYNTVKSLLDEKKAQRTSLNQQTADVLKRYVDKDKYIDISSGTEYQLGVTKTRMDNAIALLEEQGYKKHMIQVDQMGTNHKTTITVLTPPEVTYSDVSENRYDIRFPGQDSRVIDSKGDVKSVGRAVLSEENHPVSVNSDRIKVVYNEEGGAERDGLIQLRRGVDDISLGGKQYAQVRIAVDDTHYLKGMAVYSDNMPPGIDILYNSNKHLGTPKLDTFKKMERTSDGKIDWENPFGASVTQKELTTADGSIQKTAINIVREEGEWQTWSKNLPSQFLSKQPVKVAERQLNYDFLDKKVELDEIKSLENPVVKKKLLLAYADKCDAAASELKAAPFAKQQTHVILPFPELSDKEIYAPNYKDGTKVALVRFPHGGTFEIPELTVRNKGSAAESVIKNAPDAVGINAKTAAILSGADFDGDTVMVIPISEKVKVRTTPPLDGLKNFDPKEAYPKYEGMQVIKAQTKQTEMGIVSNLITDMTLKGAPPEDIERAVRHSMVVIDSEKHELNYKQSEKDNRIAELKNIYQDNGDGHAGASTIISRAGSETSVPERKDWYASSTSIGPNGEKIYKETGGSYKDAKLKYGPVELKTDARTGKTYYLNYDDVTGKKKRVYADQSEIDRINSGFEGVKFDSNGRVKINEDKKTGQLYYLKGEPGSNKKVRVPVSESDLMPGSLKENPRMQDITRMDKASDAYELTSGGSKEHYGYLIEKVYADYANNMKALANSARKEWLETPNLVRNKEAAVTYKAEVESLNNQLAKAKANSPVERQAQLMANQRMEERKRANPDMTKDDIKKYKGREIIHARNKLGAKKSLIEITDQEWKAIQAGAISHNKLADILDNADLDKVREKATPRSKKTVTPTMKALAKSMENAGYTTAQIADRLGISASTVYNVVSG